MLQKDCRGYNRIFEGTLTPQGGILLRYLQFLFPEENQDIFAIV